jgi:hypothetical protein
MANNVPMSAKTALIQRGIVLRPTNAISIKLALMLTAAGNARDAYTTTSETTATGYTAGGVAVTSLVASNGTTKGLLDAGDTSFGTLTGNFQYGDLYDDGNSPKQVFVTYDFGAQSPSGVTVTVQWPTPDDTNAMFRIA